MRPLLMVCGKPARLSASPMVPRADWEASRNVSYAPSKSMSLAALNLFSLP